MLVYYPPIMSDMSENVQSAKRTSTLKKMLPGLAISAIALVILFLLVDLEDVKEALQMADYRYLFPTAILFFITIGTRSLGWRTILQEKVSFMRTYITENEGYLLNNVLPFRLGEIGRAFLLSRTTPLSFWEVLPTIMVERIFDVGFMAGFLLLSVPFVIGAEWALEAAIIAGGLVIAGFVALYIVARNKEGTIKLFNRLTQPWPRLTEFSQGKLESFLDGLAALQSLSRFGRVFFWLMLTWISNLLWYFVLLKAFVPEAQLLWAMFAVGVVSLGVAAPSTPAYIGVYETMQVSALALFGIGTSTAFAYAVVAHALYFTFTIIVGGISLAQDGLTLGEVFQQVRDRRA
jgi:uncharacterized protein (TIRG00374 family)